MYTTSMCSFLKLKLYFAEELDLVNLACVDSGHVMCDNYTATYANY